MDVLKASGNDELLLRELMAGLAAAGREATLSVGVLGSATHAAQPPLHCLRGCLGGDPASLQSRGCPVLTSAAHNEINTAALSDGRCARGFAVSLHSATVGGAPAITMTVEGQPVTPDGPVNLDLLGHLDTTAQIVQRVSEVLEENVGFANELLKNYEQLNLIFDLTRQISKVTDAILIEKLLLQRVVRLLALETAYLATSGGEWRAYGPRTVATHAGPPEPLLRLSELQTTIDGVRSARQVQVAVVGQRQVLAGPLVRLDEQVDVVLAFRSSSAPAYSSGDMLLIESMLAFGGQIISNCELHQRLHHMSVEVTRALVAAIDKKDHYTSGHSERGGFLTRITAQELGLPPAEQQIMEWAGLLHDVGKIGIPEEILCKPGKLTPEEFEVIKQHPRMGYEILKPIASFGLVLDGVLYHHEYPDGSGYPTGLKGDAIPLVARIIHVVDTFDALTSTRAYRKAFTIEKAIEILNSEKGTRIDAQVVEAFLRAFERYRREDPQDFAVRFAATVSEEAEHVNC